MIKRSISISCLYGLLLFTSISVNSEKLDITASAYEIMELVDKQLYIPWGLNRVQLTITTKKGQVVVYKVSHFKKDENSLLYFDSTSRGRVLKILYNDSGENIYVYDVHNKRFYNKSEDDKFEYILASGFSYYDLSDSKFLGNYTPKINGLEKSTTNSYLRIENIPLDNGVYSKINVLVDHQKNYQVKRIDYYDRAGVLLKSLKPTFGKLPLRTKTKVASQVVAPLKFEIAHMAYGSSSIYEFLFVDQSANLNKALFDKQNIEK